MKTKKWTNHFSDIKNEYVKSYNIPAGGTIDTGISGIKLLLFSSIMITGTSLLVLTYAYGNLIRIGSASEVFSINNETGSYFLIYQDTNSYTIKIKNNHTESLSIEVEVLNL
ncbi:MAG: hypothetical protein VB054_04900 [Petrimonas sp.]|nr:hypothetical protein [Petrimonas sp.]